MTGALKREASVGHGFGQKPQSAGYLGCCCVFYFTLTPVFLHKVTNLMGLQSLMKKNFKGCIYIFPLDLHESHVMASVGSTCDGARLATVYLQFSHLIIRERADHPCITCLGIMAFLASGPTCGAVRHIWICDRRKTPKADRN